MIELPEKNRDSVMFLGELREKLKEISEMGYIDAYRKFHEKEGYTWWLRAFKAKERNIGWRIDYIFVSRELEKELAYCYTLPELSISDHCPVVAVFRK